MVQYDKYVLNQLLDTYESSLLSIGENKRTIHIEFSFVKKTIPAYFDESSQEYEKIHIQMCELEEKQLIQILWKGKKKGHIISKVRLDTEMLEQAYAYVHRTPKNDMADLNLQMLEDYIGPDTTIVCRTFAKYLSERLKEHKSVKEFIGLEETDQTRRLLDTIQAIEKNREQSYIREFSIIHFQDSKTFEKMVGRVAHVFKRFKENCEEMEPDEILAEYSIYHTPNYVYLKGEAQIFLGEEKIELSALRQGIGISGEDIGKVRFADMEKVKRVITIENLTTYFRWDEEDSLMIYLGGYHNSVRRALLQEIYACHPEAVYLHFGDIDAGGFDIYRNLKEKTGIPFEMYHMDMETLQYYEKYGKRLTEHDRKRLQGMKDSEEFGKVICYMLEHDVKLEQECMGNHINTTGIIASFSGNCVVRQADK